MFAPFERKDLFMVQQLQYNYNAQQTSNNNTSLEGQTKQSRNIHPANKIQLRQQGLQTSIH